jgi:hypothetical protein
VLDKNKYIPKKRLRQASHSGVSSSRPDEKECIVSASASIGFYEGQHNGRVSRTSSNHGTDIWTE